MFFSFESQNELSDILDNFEVDLSATELQELSFALTSIAASCLSMRVTQRSVGRELPTSENKPKKNNPQLSLPGMEVDTPGRDVTQSSC